MQAERPRPSMLDVCLQPLNCIEWLVLTACSVAGLLGFMIGLVISVVDNTSEYRAMLTYIVLVFVLMLVVLGIVREIRAVRAMLCFCR